MAISSPPFSSPFPPPVRWPRSPAQQNFNSNQQKTNSNIETTIFTKPKPSLYRHPKQTAISTPFNPPLLKQICKHTRTHAHTHKHNFAPGDILAPESLLPRSSRSPSHCRSEVKIAVWHQPTNLGHHKITYPIKKTTHALTTTTVRRMAASGREISRNGSLSQALRVKQAKIK